MTSAQAKRLSLLAVVLAAGVSYVKQVKSPEDASLTRTVTGAVLTGMILTAIADYSPNVAGPFAALILTATLARSAPTLVETLYPGAGR